MFTVPNKSQHAVSTVVLNLSSQIHKHTHLWSHNGLASDSTITWLIQTAANAAAIIANSCCNNETTGNSVMLLVSGMSSTHTTTTIQFVKSYDGTEVLSVNVFLSIINCPAHYTDKYCRLYNTIQPAYNVYHGV